MSSILPWSSALAIPRRESSGRRIGSRWATWPFKTSTGRDSRFRKHERLTDAGIFFCRALLGSSSSPSLRTPDTEHLEGLSIGVRELMDLIRCDEDDIPLPDIPEGRDVIRHRQELRPPP